MEPIFLIRNIVRRVAPGRYASFTEAHVLKALEIVSSEPRIGRKSLGEALGLNEGVARTLLRHIKEANLIEVTKKGIKLSEQGTHTLAALQTFISGGIEVPRSALTIGAENYAVLIKGVKRFIRNGVEQRDAALKAGAMGATTLVFNGEKLTLPGMQEPPPKMEEVINLLLSRLKPMDGDVIIIGTASDILLAEMGAKTAALELLKQTDKREAPSTR